MNSWPGTLPQALLRENLGEALPTQLAASDQKGMTPQIQKVSRTGLHEITGDVRLTVAQKVIFRTFVYSTCGLCGSFTAPATFIGDGVAHTFKLMQAPQYKAFGDGFIASLKLQVLA